MREKLIDLLNQGADKTPCHEECWDKKCNDCIRESQADHLIANDVVQVVRCKDCKHRGSNLCPMETVELYPWFGSKNDAFCSYGERREGE